MLYDFFFFFQIAALLVGLILHKKLAAPFKYFPPFLLLVTLYELGTLQNWFTIDNSNVWSFNIITSIEFIFYSLVLQMVLTNKKNKGIFFYALVFTIVFTVLYIMFFKSFNTLNTYSFSLQALVIITACCSYFYELMHDVLIETPILRQPGFWLCTGLLFYYLGGFLFFASFSYMAYKESYSYLLLYRGIINISNIILYSCLIKSFLCFNHTKV